MRARTAANVSGIKRDSGRTGPHPYLHLRCAALVFAGLFALASASAARGDELPQLLDYLKLCDGTTLAGWEQDPQPGSPWRLEEGRLVGSQAAGPLRVLHTFGTAIWKLSLDAAPGSSFRVDFPEVPGTAADQAPEPRLSVCFAPGTCCGRIHLGDSVAAEGSDASRPGPWGLEIEIKADELLVRVNEQAVSRVALTPRRRGLALNVSSGDARLSPILFRETGAVPFWNGHDLAGFTDASPASWVVEDGAIVNLAKNGNYLRSDTLHGNFTLRLNVRIVERGNSGVGIRTPVGKWPSADGMEIQVLDEPPGAPISHETIAGVYRNMPAFRRTDKRYPEWNEMTIKADGPMIGIWVNGLLVNHVNLSRHSTLRWRPAEGWIGFQDHNNRVEFRNIEIVEAPAGQGFPEWTSPHPAVPPGQACLGPLLDPSELWEVRATRELVRQGDMLTGGTLPSELARVDGPAALTRIYRTNASGEVALYFDDEPQPRIRSSWNSLSKHVPAVGQSSTTLYTYVPFSKSLRIVQTGDPPALVQFGFMRYPTGTQLASGVQPLGGPDRGWMFALAYAKQHHSSGIIPFEPALRVVSQAGQRLEPGQSQVLAEADGAGQSRWWRLAPGSSDVLQHLWLDVFVDGEQTPAITAPARLLFPCFIPENGDYQPGSYVLTRNNGWYNLLPLAFGQGLKIVGRNMGDKSLSGVSIEVGIKPLTIETAPKFRLRGRLLRESDPPVLEVGGSGRLVSMTWDDPRQNWGVVRELVVDDVPQPDFQGIDLAAWLGRDTPDRVQNSGVDGTAGTLAWRYFLADPIAWERSLRLQCDRPLGPRGSGLFLYYAAP